MQPERKKIYQLSPEELRNLVIVNYIKLGIHMAINDVRLHILIPEVYRFNAKIWTDTFDNIFSEFADGNLPGVEKLEPTVSTYFIKLIRSAYFLREHNKKIVPEEKNKEEEEFRQNKGKVAYTMFMKYCNTYRRFPENAPWLLLLKFLTEESGWKVYDGFYNEPFHVQIKTARVHVKRFAKEFFTRRERAQLAA